MMKVLIWSVLFLRSVGDHVVSLTLGSYWDSPKVTTYVFPPSEDNLTIELDVDTMFHEVYIATGITQSGYYQEIVCDSWAPV